MAQAKSSKRKSSPGRPRREDIAAMEDKLLSVAASEFLENGYGGASMNRIVSQAGISKTTLYSRYPSKADLFRAIVQQQISDMAPESILPAEPDLEAGLTIFANHILQQSLKGDMLEINRLMYSESARFPELAAAAADRTQRGIRRIAAYIERCAEAGGSRCDNAEQVAEVFILLIRGWYMNVMLTNQKVSAAARKRWVSHAVRIILNAPEGW